MSDDSRWTRLERLFAEALELPDAARARFVRRETADDVELRAELTELLEAHSDAGRFLDRVREELLGSEDGTAGVLTELFATPELTDPWMGRTVSHYTITERLGGGGMGVVYRARDDRLDRFVALKFIAPEICRDPEARERFVREAKAASSLEHPNICTVHEIGEVDHGRLFIVMPAYEGETVRERIAHDGRLDEDRALDIGEQMASGLSVAHARGIVHGDVKPANVFVTRNEVVKLLDFGLARAVSPTGEHPGEQGGTVPYLSPERRRGGGIDARADVWAVGVTLFEMLTGLRPFEGSEGPAFDALGGASSPVVPVLERALAPDPAERFPEGGALLEAVSQARRAGVSDDLSVGVAPSGLGLRSWFAGGAVVLGAGALFAWGAARWSGPALPSGEPTVSRILWVDDNPSNNRAVANRLRERGIDVEIALNTVDGVSRYDPLLTELVVSDMGRYEGIGEAYVERAGFDLLERLKARDPDVRLVFCTSPRAVRVFSTEALAAGAVDIVTDCSDLYGLVGL